MTTVPLAIAATNYFENLVVKDRSDFHTSAFLELTTNAVDADTLVVDTLRVTNLNQTNSISTNPFAGLSLAPNELVALTATKSLTTIPYSADDVANSVIQRSGTNSLVNRFVGLKSSTNQLVFRTGDTITLSAAQNSYVGSLGFGGQGGALNLVLSGSSSVINDAVGVNRIVIADSSTTGMFIHVLMECGEAQEAAYVFTKNNIEQWRLSLQDQAGSGSTLELQKGGSSYWTFSMNVANNDVDFRGNIFPAAANTYSLGSSLSPFSTIFLTTQSITNVIGTANFTNAPATGLATTAALTTAFQDATSPIAFDNLNLATPSGLMYGVSAYSGTTGVPLIVFRRLNVAYEIGNVADDIAQPLDGTVQASFCIMNPNGTGP